MKRLAGRTALVTGGGVGIGRAIALGLAREGARVAVTYNNHEPDEEFLAELVDAGSPAPLTRHLDVMDEGAVSSAVEDLGSELGGLDIVVNNAGGLLARTPIAEMELELWERVLTLNLSSVFLVSRESIRLLRDGGRIVNVASLAGRNGGSGGATAYATAKAGMFGFTRGLAKELAPRAITVNAVAPGLILDTPFHETFTPPEAQRAAINTIALERAGLPDDVAGPVIWLCSQESAFVTGTVIDINGGQYFA